MKYLFAVIVLIHGAIHWIGFAHAFDYHELLTINREITKPIGALWLLTLILFVVVAIMVFAGIKSWPLLAILAVLVSQILIISVWTDARFGTIANLAILLVSVAAWGTQAFEASYAADVRANLERTHQLRPELLSPNDLEHLPKIVQKYLHRSGAVGKPKVVSAKIAMHGEMRSRKQDWFTFTTEQYNFFDRPTRLFFMNARMFGLTVPGYHRYQDGSGSMDIRLFGLIPVMQMSGANLDQAETVTVFNDMCLLVPGTLIDRRISWEEIDSVSVKAIFTNGSHVISAVLFFNDEGELVNFESDDRYDVNAEKKIRFSTPWTNYTAFGDGFRGTYGEAIWHYPEGMFVYGKFTIDRVEYPARSVR